MNVDTIAKVLGGRKTRAGSYMVHCVGHNDSDPSLSITEKDGKLLVNCFAGCSQSSVIQGLKARGLWPENPKPRKTGQLGPVVAEYFYTDEFGVVLSRVTRHNPKDFRQWHPDGNGGWLAGVKDTRRVPYRLPEVIEAAIVFIVEGEKDVETLRGAGFVATCCPMGAGKWREEYNVHFGGKSVIVVPDGDEPGRAHARQVMSGIKPLAAQVISLDLEDAKDISEWFERGHSEVELIETLESVWVEALLG